MKLGLHTPPPIFFDVADGSGGIRLYENVFIVERISKWIETIPNDQGVFICKSISFAEIMLKCMPHHWELVSVIMERLGWGGGCVHRLNQYWELVSTNSSSIPQIQLKGPGLHTFQINVDFDMVRVQSRSVSILDWHTCGQNRQGNLKFVFFDRGLRWISSSSEWGHSAGVD